MYIYTYIAGPADKSNKSAFSPDRTFFKLTILTYNSQNSPI